MNRRKISARAQLASTLAEEILSSSSEGTFAIDSEHQLCRRFNISRVTVRLALIDLEARGLIFRRHGKGTFAHGRMNRIRKSLGILLKTIPTVEQWPISEMIRGFQTGASALRMNVLLIHASPQEWSSEMIKDLGGVLLVPSGLARADVDFFEHVKIPSLLAWESSLRGCCIDFGQAESARLTTEKLLLDGHDRIALLTGFEENLDALKRAGVKAALASLGKDPEGLVEFLITSNDAATRGIFESLVGHDPQFDAIVAADDGIAARFFDYLHTYTAIKVPDAMSIASFHQSPFLVSRQPPLSTVAFDFFGAGKRAAESLNRASLTGEVMENVQLPGIQLSGSTIGHRSRTNRAVLI